MQNIQKHLLLFYIFLSLGALSQPAQIKFEHLTIENGLSQSSVSSIVQDNKGFLWFGTLDGLNKYNGYEFKKYYSNNDSNSLPNNIINKIILDSNNNIWIATGKGLCKYNKTKDNFIRIKDNKTNIQEQIIVDIKDNGNSLWIASEQKFFIYNKLKHEIREIPLPKKLESQKLNNIYLLNNQLWIIAEESICRLNKNDNRFVIINFAKNKLNLKNPQALFISKNKTIYLGTDKYLAELNNINKDSYNVKIINNKINITSITEDEHGIIWVGTKKTGLFSYNAQTKRFINYNHNPANIHSLSVNNITSLYYSKAGILWIGTELGGINKWNRLIEDIHIFRKNPYNNKSLSSNMVRSVYIDKKDRTWIGTVDKGLNLWIIDKNIFRDYILDNKNINSIAELSDGSYWQSDQNKFKHFVHNPKDKHSIPNNHVRSIMETKSGNLWVGTDGGGIAKLNMSTWQFETLNTLNSNLSNDNIWKIYQDTKGNIWIATNGGGLNLFNEETKTFKIFKHNENDNKSLSSNKTSTIFEDSNGNLWIGTLDKGLNKFNFIDSTFTRYTHNKNDSTSIPFNRVYSIVEDSKHNLWLGLKGCLSNFDYKKNKFNNFNTDDGLPNNVVMGVLEDSKGDLWISTNNGICEFSKEKGVIRNFNVNDGLQSNEFLVGSFFKSKTGVMHFGGIGGLNLFKPSKLKKNANIPSVVITEFTIMNKKADIDTVISEMKEITINWDENIFSLGFVAIDYIASQENEYKIKLVGIDKDWIDYGTRRYVSYNNLPYGDYIFRVKGSNNDGVWNEKGTSIIIHVLPPWWETTWFKITVIIFLIIAILFWIKWRERKLKRDKKILEEKVRQRTQIIREQKEDIEKKNSELEMALEEVESQRDEIESQRDEIEAQRDTVIEQKEQIEEIHHEISESINYAKRLQQAILPNINVKHKYLSDYFVMFKPKDKVSGDFFWGAFVDNEIIVVTADCTGHGVPGAFMSMLGISFLREIVLKERITHPGEVLNRLRAEVIKTLGQKGKIGEQKDGMDMSFLSINYDTKMLRFAGANNPLYIVKRGKLKVKSKNSNAIKLYELDELSNFKLYEVKPNKMPIAIYDKMDDFTTHEMLLEQGDKLYIFSDGFADQFGGPKGKKFKYKPFKQLILKNADKTMAQQKELLTTAFENWQGNIEQVDDVVVIGLTI